MTATGNEEVLMRGAGTKVDPQSGSGGVEVREVWIPPPGDRRDGAGGIPLIPSVSLGGVANNYNVGKKGVGIGGQCLDWGNIGRRGQCWKREQCLGYGTILGEGQYWDGRQCWEMREGRHCIIQGMISVSIGCSPFLG